MSTASDFDLFSGIFEKVRAGVRLDFEDGVKLYRSGNLLVLGKLAQIARHRLHANRVFYSLNLHINHTNICSEECLFCAFAKSPDHKDAYTLTPEEIQDKVREALIRQQINEVHITGGHNPALNLDYYVEMIRLVRETSPRLFIKALSAPEIADLAERSGLSNEDILNRLRDAGLNGLPGGGAEIFSPETRQIICPDKITAAQWLDVHATAHRLGLLSNATMLYGHIETPEDRVNHVLKLRELQDRTHGLRAFIPLAYKAGNNRMAAVGESGGVLDLKVYAISRLMLDNIPHIKVHWSTVGLKLAQVALSFGVDDLGGIHLNERIMHDAGSETPVDLSREALEDLILRAGYQPCCVDSAYGATDFNEQKGENYSLTSGI